MKLSSREATCQKEGRLAYWHCEGCDKYFLDAGATKEVTQAETVIEKLPHAPAKTDKVEPICGQSGKAEYWTCSSCKKFFLDETCLVQVEESQLVIPTTEHNLQHVNEIPVDGAENGVKEHWTCLFCEGYFADADGEKSSMRIRFSIQ